MATLSFWINGSAGNIPTLTTTPQTPGFSSGLYGTTGLTVANRYALSKWSATSSPLLAWGTSLQPDAQTHLNSSGGIALDCFATDQPYTGDFSAGTWSFAVPLGGYDGSSGETLQADIRIRVWKSANVDGSSATEITTSAHAGSAPTFQYSPFAYVASNVSWSAPAFSLANEYLFIQFGFKIRVAATQSTSAYVTIGGGGPTGGGAAVTTTNFNPNVNVTAPSVHATTQLGSPGLENGSDNTLQAPSVSATAVLGALSNVGALPAPAGVEAAAVVGGVVIDAVSVVGPAFQTTAFENDAFQTEMRVGVGTAVAHTNLGSVIAQVDADVDVTGLETTSAVGDVIYEAAYTAPELELSGALGFPGVDNVSVFIEPAFEGDAFQNDAFQTEMRIGLGSLCLHTLLGTPAITAVTLVGIDVPVTGLEATCTVDISKGYATHSTGFTPAPAIIDNIRIGTTATNPPAFLSVSGVPFEVDFDASYTIDKIIVYNAQDTAEGFEPTDTDVFAASGSTDTTVETWDGAAWVVAGSVTGSNLVKQTFTFAPVATTKIRITGVNSSGFYWLTEVAAWKTGGDSTNVALGGSARFTIEIGQPIVGLEATSALGTLGEYQVTYYMDGGVASASSYHKYNHEITGGAFSPWALNNNDRIGKSFDAGTSRWTSNHVWIPEGTDGAPWAQIDFPVAKNVDTVIVYSMFDNLGNTVEPDTDFSITTFADYGAVGFTVQTWNGSAWVTKATVTGNSLIKRVCTFASVSTTAIRVNITSTHGFTPITGGGTVGLTEIAAWGTNDGIYTNVALAARGGVWATAQYGVLGPDMNVFPDSRGLPYFIHIPGYYPPAMPGYIVTAAVGSVQVTGDVNYDIDGVQGAAAVGAVVYEAEYAVTGVQGTSAPGSVSWANDYPIAGVQSVARVGTTYTGAVVDVAAPAVQAAGAVGAPLIKVHPVFANELGVQGGTGVGAVTFIIDCNVHPVGIYSTALFNPSNIMVDADVAVAGLASIGQVGTTVAESAYAVLGVQAAAQVGTTSPTDMFRGLEGVQCSGHVGAVTIHNDYSVSPVGLYATGLIGSPEFPHLVLVDRGKMIYTRAPLPGH